MKKAEFELKRCAYRIEEILRSSSDDIAKARDILSDMAFDDGENLKRTIRERIAFAAKEVKRADKLLLNGLEKIIRLEPAFADSWEKPEGFKKRKRSKRKLHVPWPHFGKSIIFSGRRKRVYKTRRYDISPAVELIDLLNCTLRRLVALEEKMSRCSPKKLPALMQRAREAAWDEMFVISLYRGELSRSIHLYDVMQIEMREDERLAPNLWG